MHIRKQTVESPEHLNQPLAPDAPRAASLPPPPPTRPPMATAGAAFQALPTEGRLTCPQAGGPHRPAPGRREQSLRNTNHSRQQPEALVVHSPTRPAHYPQTAISNIRLS